MSSSQTEAQFRKLAEPVAQYAEACSEGLLSVNDEISRFIANRIAHTGEILSEMTKTNGSPVSVLQLQNRFVTDALNDYQESTQRIFAIGGRVMQGMLDQTRREVGTVREVTKTHA